MAVKKILSIDGGGIRGVIPAMILSELEEAIGKSVSEMFDLIAGTSTGGILALGLVKPSGDNPKKPAYSAKDMLGLYENEGKHIFSSNLWHEIESLNGILEEKYPSKGIETALKQYFGDEMLSKALLPIFITSYDIEGRSPHFFQSYTTGDPGKKREDFPMWKAARSTSAAPTYFEVFKLATCGPVDYCALIDGGVFANNPAMCAYVEGKKLFGDDTDIVVVSIGTGSITMRYSYDEAKDWGLAEWAKPILDIVFDGVSETVDYQLNRLLPDNRYFRLQSDLSISTKAAMDDASKTNIEALKRDAQSYINKLESAGVWEKLCKALKE